jgi:hypothetical protein
MIDPQTGEDLSYTQEQRPRQFNPNEHLIQLKSRDGSKDYLPVQWRLVWYREQCPQGTIDTEEILVDLDREVEAETFVWNQQTRRSEKVIKQAKGYARFRATVTDGKGGRASATGSESAADFNDYVEKAETKAIGRALAALGFGTQFAPELNEERRIVDSPVDSNEPKQQPKPQKPQQPKPQAPTGTDAPADEPTGTITVEPEAIPLTQTAKEDVLTYAMDLLPPERKSGLMKKLGVTSYTSSIWKDTAKADAAIELLKMVKPYEPMLTTLQAQQEVYTTMVINKQKDCYGTLKGKAFADLNAFELLLILKDGASARFVYEVAQLCDTGYEFLRKELRCDHPLYLYCSVHNQKRVQARMTYEGYLKKKLAEHRDTMQLGPEFYEKYHNQLQEWGIGVHKVTISQK